jgi:two-component system nitrogen regulation response regulator GlnG
VKAKHILLVDDEESISWALGKALEQEGYRVSTSATAAGALEIARRSPVDAVFLDVRLPDMDGLHAMEQLQRLSGNAPVIVITAYGNLSTAVRAVEGGAFDYLVKPFDLHQALASVSRALEMLVGKTDGGNEALDSDDALIGTSPMMQAVFKRIALVAPRDASVLITGESGTGKELTARAIHRHSPRRDRPFLPVHLAALSPTLVESELFGHARGAFTGAVQAKPGLLALAEGGTIFLDEIGDVPLAVQTKLLRVLEESVIYPVGGSRPLPLNVRILAATHQDLSSKVADGSFRHDLFFRLNVFQIHLPPLRDRPEDIEPLAEHFLRRIEPTSPPLPAATRQFLRSQTWRGNVRELRNAVEHAAIVARGGPLLPEHFPQAATAASSPLDAASQLDRAVRRWFAERWQNAGKLPDNLHDDLLRIVETALLDDLMRRVNNNRWEAARRLGLNRATVRKKLTLYGLAEADDEENQATAS